jgi:type I restriction enzyme, S subunit
MTAWPLVPLGKLLKRRKDEIDVQEHLEYARLTIRMNGKGIDLRDRALGSEIGTKRQFIAKAGQLVLSKIDARNGAFGILPNQCDQAIITGNFWAFEIDDSRLDPKFFEYFTKTADFLEFCIRASEGTTNRRYLQEAQFLGFYMPLPPSEEQRGLVEQLLAFSDRYSNVLRLRQESEVQLEALCRSILFSDTNSQGNRMSDLVSIRQPDTKVERHNSYQFAGVYCFGRGVFKGQTKNGTEFAYDRLTKIRAGEFTYPKLMAWEGALGVVPDECDGLFVSPEYPVFTIDTERVLPEVLEVYYRTPSVWPIIGGASTGTNVRRRRLHPLAFLNLRMPVPPMATQVKIRKVRQAFESVAAIRRDSAAEVKALLGAVLNRAFNSPNPVTAVERGVVPIGDV